MRAIAVNGSPKKNWNTASLLEHALAGAAKDGSETKLVHLYDLDFKGCISCFACKKIGGKSYGRCAVSDGLTPLLKKALEADVLILGTPVTSGLKLGRWGRFWNVSCFRLSPTHPAMFLIFRQASGRTGVYDEYRRKRLDCLQL
jgi:multimeric flavodoxin WrbA